MCKLCHVQKAIVLIRPFWGARPSPEGPLKQDPTLHDRTVVRDMFSVHTREQQPWRAHNQAQVSKILSLSIERLQFLFLCSLFLFLFDARSPKCHQKLFGLAPIW
jgi:hypothetical protein